MHFYESSIITTKDGLHCQVYGNEHPQNVILVKPKYIPTDKVSSDQLPYRFISGQKMNRLNLWADKNALASYIEAFSLAYPHYIFKSTIHQPSPLFFGIPKSCIERAYFPQKGLSDLISMLKKDLDDHLVKVYDFVNVLLKSGLSLPDFGLTYSTLMGHYSPNVSDINIVVYGKEKFWKLMSYLQTATHKDLRWKTYEEWEDFYSKRNRHMVHNKEQYIENMYQKKSEGFFKETLFVIFAVENPGETWFTWGKETYKRIGTARFRGTITNHANSVVRPGCYTIKDSTFVDGDDACTKIKIDKIVFFSRDYSMLAYIGETVEVSGMVENVTASSGAHYHRIVVGYFDTYLNGTRDNEYIKVIAP